jgi:SAM-dependent methyltransferase
VSKSSRHSAAQPGSYDPIAGIYDAWSQSVREDVAFYVEEARRSGGPVVELGVGTGRIAIPIARAGLDVIGVDSSERMLTVAGAAAASAGVEERLDLRLGDLRRPPVEGPVPLVICPFRSLLHMRDDADRMAALAAVYNLLSPGGHFVFDVFEPAQDDIDETHGRWLEREPGIFERADWNTESRTLTLSVRAADEQTTMALAWLSPGEWRMLLKKAGFDVEACLGWFDRRPYTGGEDSIWIVRRPRV